MSKAWAGPSASVHSQPIGLDAFWAVRTRQDAVACMNDGESESGVQQDDDSCYEAGWAESS